MRGDGRGGGGLLGISRWAAIVASNFSIFRDILLSCSHI